jgi:predicted DNA repair protein MutK
VPAAALGADAEEKTIAGAIRTDFILSAEIMVIALKEVIEEPVVSRGSSWRWSACSSPSPCTASSRSS